ncbi:OmpP1/FadL family transporter [Flavobacterium adhaerens]|uniref:OmpP1/FadL family transporter n=1 Tax=Flavobacterium adhaerens TaxID=3149043 RepID=UPI0032B3956F
MKKNLLLFLAIGLITPIVHSQEIKDALRYAKSDLQGTARFTSMSGAFGALGGDLSSLQVNPAGSAVFNNNQFATTMGFYDIKNNSNYFETASSASQNNFDLNQAGGVFVFKTRNPNNALTKISFAINYENTNNFDNSLFSTGVSPLKSIDGYFISYANGVPLGLLENGYYADLDNGDQQAFLGYQAYIINPVTEDENNTLYTSNVRSGGNYYQTSSTYTSGYNGKLIFNSGVQIKDFLFLGLNLNSHFTDYIKNTNFYESNNNDLDTNYEVQSLNFSNSLHTYGSGFSFQVGAIAKLTQAVRVGLSYESPTWYNLRDELSQRLSSISSNNVNSLPPDVVDPFVINYYAPYELRTPGSLSGSFAYVFGKTGLISIDYKYKDYSCTQFEPENDPYFRSLNDIMQNTLGSSSEIRIGGEYRIQNLKLRGGYRFEGSPYKNTSMIGDLNSFSGGFGYSFGAIKLDFSYVHAHLIYRDQFFAQGFTESARINTSKNNYTMTFTFEM